MLEVIKFSSQADPAVLESLKDIAKLEGRQFQHVLDEAMKDYIKKKKADKPRKNVMKAFEESMKEFEYLYEQLAK